MLFTSFTFLVFFSAIFLFYWYSPARFRRNLLLLASILFYAAWSLSFMLHFATIILLNHFINKLIVRSTRKTWLYLSLLLNLGNLFLFKYFYFGLEILTDVFGSQFISRDLIESSLGASLGVSSVILPLAVSFYTFQLTAYAIDLSRRSIDRPFSFPNFALFIMFFPQLIAGPIMRYGDFAHQIRKLPDILPHRDQMTGGLYLIISGLAKKMLVANNMVAYTATIFQNPTEYDWAALVSACLGFSAQLYCDFSGYTDLARGMAKLLGLELPENFFTPYFSVSVREFWNNWHRTLTLWLRDYMYIPLGGHRTSFFRSQFNIVLTMVLIGLWHGASYNFLILGLYHGILIAIESGWLRLRNLQRKSPDMIFAQTYSSFRIPARMAKAVGVFALLNFGFVLFRTPNFEMAILMYRRIFSLASGIIPGNIGKVGIALVAVLIFHLLQKYGSRIHIRQNFQYIALIVAGFALVVLLGNVTVEGTDFFYFQF